MKIYIKKESMEERKHGRDLYLKSRVFLACFEIGEEIIVLYFY
jgi:hypothetical protein